MKINKKTGILIGAILILIIAMIGKIFVERKNKGPEKKVPAQSESQEMQTKEVAEEAPKVIEDATLFFDRDSVSTSVGNDFSLIAKVNPGSNAEKGINAAQLDITFDPTMLELTGVVISAPFAQMSTPAIDNEKGTLSTVCFIGGSQVSQIADMATLTFHAKSSGSSPVSYASSANVTVRDDNGSMVAGTRTPAIINISQ